MQSTLRITNKCFSKIKTYCQRLSEPEITDSIRSMSSIFIDGNLMQLWHWRRKVLMRVYMWRWGMLFQASCKAKVSCLRLEGWGRRLAMVLPISSQRCSIGERSGEQAGHGSTSMICVWRWSRYILTTWGFALSCWKIATSACCWKNGYTTGISTSLMYRWAVRLPGITISSVGRLNEIPSHTMTLPLPQRLMGRIQQAANRSNKQFWTYLVNSVDAYDDPDLVLWHVALQIVANHSLTLSPDASQPGVSLMYVHSQIFEKPCDMIDQPQLASKNDYDRQYSSMACHCQWARLVFFDTLWQNLNEWSSFYNKKCPSLYHGYTWLISE